jgi:aspartyl-tRNA(Asn)/glutamyl-tRNA(Gln) amidotransferase subunit B
MRARFQTEYLLNHKDAFILTSNLALASYTEKVFSEMRNWLTTLDNAKGTEEEIWEANKKKVSKLVNGWLTSELFKLMNEQKVNIDSLKISAEQFADFLKLVYLNTVNSSAAQVILKEIFATGADAETVLEEKDLKQIDEVEVVEVIVLKIIDSNPGPVTDYKNGKEVALQFLIGQGMKETKGKANPEKLKDLFKAKLD